MKEENIEKKHIWRFVIFDEEKESKYEKVLWYLDKNKNWEFYLYIEETFISTDKKCFKMWRTFEGKVEWFYIIWTINNFQEKWNLTSLIWDNKISLLNLGSYDIIENSHFYSPDYIVFWEVNWPNPNLSSISFSFDWLFEFFWELSFELEQISENWWNPYINPDKINIKIKKENISIKILDTEDFSIYLKKNVIWWPKDKNYFSVGLEKESKYWRIQKWFEINNETFIKIDFKNWKSLPEIEEILVNLKRFFSLITWNIIFIKNLSVFYEDEKWKNRNVWVIFNKMKNWNHWENNTKELFFNFTFNDVKEDFWNILKIWFDNTEKFKTIYNLYYATLQNKNLHLENQFLNLIQAIEWFYYKIGLVERNITNEKEIEILKKISEIWLSNNDMKKIKILNEKSLSQKLKQISIHLWIEFKLNWADIKNKIEKIRNCFSHWWDREDFINLDLFNLIELLKIVLEILILKELWLKEELYNWIRDYKIKVYLK